MRPRKSACAPAISLGAAVVFALAPALAAGCTETPSFFPPCVDPDHRCLDDAGVDADTTDVAAPDANDAATPDAAAADR